MDPLDQTSCEAQFHFQVLKTLKKSLFKHFVGTYCRGFFLLGEGLGKLQ